MVPINLMEKARLEEVKSLVEVTQGLRHSVEDLNSNAPFIFTLPLA